ncbi:MAG: STAS domain-containing protein [Gemmatimonadaceae bacterium]|nr:STAS domain-containing protein [Gemmatimonadaceae bacterium]
MATVLAEHEAELLTEWLAGQRSTVRRPDLIRDSELNAQAAEFLATLRQAVMTGNVRDVQAPAYDGVRSVLGTLSRARSLQGFTPSETAMFVFSLKGPLYARLRRAVPGGPDQVIDTMAAAGHLLDQLGLYTVEVYQRSREEVIARQQEDMMELSTPVVKLWDGIVALPMIGTLDSARTQVVMETLLQRIVETGAEVAIIDITGVPTVDTLTAQHLLKTVTAARLMGADCIISGIRPQIAQTIVHLGVDLTDVTTKATLADALRLAFTRVGAANGVPLRQTPARA